MPNWFYQIYVALHLWWSIMQTFLKIWIIMKFWCYFQAIDSNKSETSKNMHVYFKLKVGKHIKRKRSKQNLEHSSTAGTFKLLIFFWMFAFWTIDGVQHQFNKSWWPKARSSGSLLRSLLTAEDFWF